MKSFRFGKHFENFEYSLFFELVSFGELSKLETYKTVEYITDNFNLDKLNLLLEDYIESLSELKAQFYFDTFTEDDYHLAVADFISNGKELPYTDYPEDNKVIDKEKLLFPDEFSAGNKFIVTLNGYIKKQESLKLQSKSVVQPKAEIIVPSRLKLNAVDYKEKLDYSLSYYSAFPSLVSCLKDKVFSSSIELIKALSIKYKQVVSDKKLLTEQIHFELDPNDVKKYFKFAFIKIDSIIDNFDKRVKDPTICYDDMNFNSCIQSFWLANIKFSDWPIFHSSITEDFVNLLFGQLKFALIKFRNALVESYSISVDTPLADLLKNKYSEIIALPAHQHLGVTEMDHFSVLLTTRSPGSSSSGNSEKSKSPRNDDSYQIDPYVSLLVSEIKQPNPISLSTIRHKRTNVPQRDFTSFFNHPKPEAIAALLLKEFSKDTPVTLTVLVHTLRYELATPLLIINNGDFSAFHQAMAGYFNGIDIGKRQLYIKKSDVIQEQYKEVILGCKSRLISILKSLDK
jgi:hypothetical protein